MTRREDVRFLTQKYGEAVIDELRFSAGEKNRWWLFDRQVESPHTTSFYVERPVDSTASAYDQESFAEVSFDLRVSTHTDEIVQAAKHWYNGEERDSRYFSGEMEEAKRLIGPLVRSVLSTREVRTDAVRSRTAC